MFKSLLGSRVWMGSPTAETYRGILMKANPRLHVELKVLLQEWLTPGARILDLGAGHGAFSRRMKDSGFEVLAVDQDARSFAASEVAFECVDFNDPSAVMAFASSHEGQFDAVVGMEVIEHVESPWDYIRLLARLARPGGLVVITTPNVLSWTAQWNQLVTGRPYHFEQDDETGSGHINPIPSWELQLIARHLGLQDCQTRGLCRLPWLWITRNVRLTIGGLLMLLLAPLRRPLLSYDIVALFARTQRAPKA